MNASIKLGQAVQEEVAIEGQTDFILDFTPIGDVSTSVDNADVVLGHTVTGTTFAFDDGHPALTTIIFKYQRT